MTCARACIASAILAALLIPGTSSGAAQTDAYPSRPIKIMVPNGAGGSIDLLTRAVADRLEGLLGQPVIVENRTGAAGVIGTQIVRVAPPDGYLLLASSSSSNTIAPHVQANVPYDGVRDFAPIINIAWTTKILVVNPALPVHTLAEFVAYAGARPGALNYSSTGIGSSAHLDIEMFSSMAGIHMVNIPYRTVGEQTAAVIANDAQFNVNSITQTSNMVRAGRLRALAVVAPRRSILLPDVPTIAEAGMPDLDFRTWSGLSAPLGTPPAVIDTLNRAVNQALADPTLLTWMQQNGFDSIGGTADGFRATLIRDDARWKSEVERLGIRER